MLGHDGAPFVPLASKSHSMKGHQLAEESIDGSKHLERFRIPTARAHGALQFANKFSDRRIIEEHCPVLEAPSIPWSCIPMEVPEEVVLRERPPGVVHRLSPLALPVRTGFSTAILASAPFLRLYSRHEGDRT